MLKTDKVIWKKGKYRIVEMLDEDYSLTDLKGDCYCPKTNSDIDPEKLKQEELDFEDKVISEGVWGYCLQVWNPEIDHGWETTDSCWGFVGPYDPITNNHYIVDELKRRKVYND